MIDASEGVGEQDAKIGGLANDRGRAMIVVLNKSDLLSRDEISKAIERTREVLNFASYAPIMLTSALSGRGTTKLLEQVLAHHPPPPQAGHSVRLYYVTQAQTEPPTFVAITNFPQYVHFSYRRYVQNQIHKHFEFVGTPVRVMYRKKKNKGLRKAGGERA
jgi:GTP-binding protein